MEFKWERLVGRTYRARVFGGWIISDEGSNGNALVFISDPEHTWEINNV